MATAEDFTLEKWRHLLEDVTLFEDTLPYGDGGRLYLTGKLYLNIKNALPYCRKTLPQKTLPWQTLPCKTLPYFGKAFLLR